MGLPAFASVIDFESRYSGSVPAVDVYRVDTLLSDASTLIREVAGDDYVDDDDALETFPALFVIVCCEAARRAYDNPQGLTGETVGNYTWRGSTSGGSVYLTPGEAKRIRKAAGRMGAVSVTMSNDLPCVYENGSGW